MPENRINEESNKELEGLLGEFAASQDREVMKKIIPVLGGSRVYMQAQFPKEFDQESLKNSKKGEPIKIPKGSHPIPAVLTSQNGGRYFGVYTARSQLRNEKKFPMLLDMPFVECCNMAARMGMDGVVVNAFTQNVTFKKPAVEAILNSFARAGQGKLQQMKLTIPQFHEFARRSVELKAIPQSVFKGGKEYFDEVCDKREKLIFETYRAPYENAVANVKGENGTRVEKIICPYDEEEFSVMDLNLTEDLMLARIDLPNKNLRPGMCIRLYLTYVPSKDSIEYFTIEEKAPGGSRLLGKVTKEGRHEVLGEAPEDGVEMQKIMDLVGAEFDFEE